MDPSDQKEFETASKPIAYAETDQETPEQK